MEMETKITERKYVDIKEVLRQKNPKLAKLVPGFALNYFKNNEYKLKLLKMVEFMTSDLLKGYVSRNKEILKLLERYG